MWRVVCIGLSGAGYPHRAVDRGPLLMQEKRARAIAQWLENTGLYARVAVERVGAIRPAAAVGVGQALDVMDADATSAN